MTPPSLPAAALLPCPFCGSLDVDPEGWASITEKGPQCLNCGATAESIEKWNTRHPAASPDDAVAKFMRRMAVEMVRVTDRGHDAHGVAYELQCLECGVVVPYTEDFPHTDDCVLKPYASPRTPASPDDTPKAPAEMPDCVEAAKQIANFCHNTADGVAGMKAEDHPLWWIGQLLQRLASRPTAKEADEALVAQIEKRASKTEKFVRSEWPLAFEDQAHLDKGTAERGYWHHGYMMACRDIIKLLKSPSPATGAAPATREG